VDEPTTKYLERDGAALAYQVFGVGPEDGIFVCEIVGHLDLLWADPHFHGNLQRIGSFSRCAMFQRRGFGLSDPVPYSPTVDQQADDIVAVRDAVGMPRATPPIRRPCTTLKLNRPAADRPTDRRLPAHRR
jgi:pimeloyl-ACP methyl ester carboxylesterase